MRSRELLLVEDNPDHAVLMCTALRKHELVGQVYVVGSSAQACDWLFGREDLPGLVLLDLHLPDADGFEVLSRVRHDPRTKCLPVVVLSSSDEEADIRTSYRLGANSYVRKPVDYLQFVEAVRHLVAYWLTLNLLPPER